MPKKIEKIKVAVFGTGFIGHVHVESLRRLGNIDVVAVAGSSEQRAQKFADEMNVEWATGDYREVLRDPEIRSVHICTPNSLHFEQTMAAFDAGKHVVCEKPLTPGLIRRKRCLQRPQD